ncbi:glycosyltransferase [Stackebrandtia nassauensis]|nr:glycosyltransferase [Stackebrandtia nassauensis]
MSTLMPSRPVRDSHLSHHPTVPFMIPGTRRVLIASDTYPPDVNGAGYFTHRLAAGLAARGNEVHVVCPSPDGPAGRETRDGVTVHRLRSHPLLLHPTMRFVVPAAVNRAIREVVTAVAPDVVHVQGHFPVGRATLKHAARVGIPTIATNHFMPDNLLHHVKVPTRLRKWVASRAWRDAAAVFARADHVTTPTRLAAEVFRDNGFTGHIEPVSCGIDLSRFHPRSTSATAARARLDLPDRKTILFVGRLDEEKRVHELIRALPSLRRRVDAQLVIAGTGPQGPALTRLAADLGISAYVRFLGFVPDADLPGVYRAADLFAIAGVAELQSIVTLEAMASGLPVVAADAVALPHLVRNGHNGFLFTPGDIDGISTRLEVILESADEIAAMGAASRAMAAEHDHARSLARFEEIYTHLAAPARSRI